MSVVSLVAEDRPVTARKLAMRLIDRADSLGEFPELGRLFEPLAEMGIRLLVEPPYVLAYQVLGDPPVVLVLALRHQREPEVDALELASARESVFETGEP